MNNTNDKITKLISNMDLPPHRKTTFTPANISWLIKNMGTRNSQHPNYESAMKELHALTINNRQATR